MKLSVRIPGLLLACSLLGCQAENRPTVWTGDAKSISDLMDDWNDVDKTNTTAAAFLFAKDVKPTVAQLKVFREYTLRQNGAPKVNGTTATMPILVYSRKIKGEPTPLEWSFEKEGEDWKIKTAPLP